MRRGPLAGLTLLLAACLLWAEAGHAASASNPLTVTAAVLSKNSCKFSNANVANMTVPIDPTSGADASMSINWQLTCRGSSNSVAWMITANDGSNFSGPGARRMAYVTTSGTLYLPYGLDISPFSGTTTKGATVTVALKVTVSYLDFRVAVPATYTDTVTITLQP